MIELKVADFCHDCPEFKPNVDKDIMHFDTFCGVIEKQVRTKITCVHDQRCRSMINFLEAQRKEKSNA